MSLTRKTEFNYVMKRADLNKFVGIEETERDERYRQKDATSTQVSTKVGVNRKLEEEEEVSQPQTTSNSNVDKKGSLHGSDDKYEDDVESLPDSEPRTQSATILTTSDGSIKSNSDNLHRRIRRYVLDLLCHKLQKFSPQRPSVIGTIKEFAYPGEVIDFSIWSLTWDASVTPSRESYAILYNLDERQFRWLYWVAGVELVSPILELDDENKWLPQFQQIHVDLKNVEHSGAYFTGTEGLHIHLSITNSPEMSLRVVQNVMALYGIFESEIVSWLHPRRRDNVFALSLRKGVEDFRPVQEDGTEAKAKKYTPQIYTERIYATQNLDALKILVGGTGGRGPATGFRNPKYVAVHISSRPGKKTTLEFRQHQGTLEPDSIKWWVLFLGYLMRHAILVEQQNDRLLNEDHLGYFNETGRHYVEEVPKQYSILDWINFPEDGKEFLKKQSRVLYDNDEGRFEKAKRSLEAILIKGRSELNEKGEDTAYLDAYQMDQAIMSKEPFIRAKKDLEKILGRAIELDVGEPDNVEGGKQKDFEQSIIDNYYSGDRIAFERDKALGEAPAPPSVSFDPNDIGI